MAEQNDSRGRPEPPRPHGDPLKQEIVEPNPAQRQSDSPEDGVGREEPTEGTRSTANGINGWDDDGGQRRRQYDNGAEIVSKID